VVARREDRVSVSELAHWIIEDKKDFVLIDVRSANDCTRGHIDGVRNLPPPEFDEGC
jgi:rhodanese-related sulfurtransferase